MASPDLISAPNGAANARTNAPPDDEATLLAEIQFKRLDRLCQIGMNLAEAFDGVPVDASGKKLNASQAAHAFDKLSRAIRQIMAMQQEIIGLREKRKAKIRQQWLTGKKTAVRQSVEHSLDKAGLGPDKPRRERLLADLFSDLRDPDFESGNVRDIVEDICKTLGIEADLSLWEAPQPADIALPAKYDWIVPANGDKPYTVVASPTGGRYQVTFDSPYLKNRATAPP